MALVCGTREFSGDSYNFEIKQTDWNRFVSNFNPDLGQYVMYLCMHVNLLRLNLQWTNWGFHWHWMTLSLTNLEEEVERKWYLGTPSLLYLVAKGDFWTIRVGILLTHMILAQQCICMLDMSTVQTDACKGYTRKNSGSGTKLYTELKTE